MFCWIPGSTLVCISQLYQFRRIHSICEPKLVLLWNINDCGSGNPTMNQIPHKKYMTQPPCFSMKWIRLYFIALSVCHSNPISIAEPCFGSLSVFHGNPIGSEIQILYFTAIQICISASKFVFHKRYHFDGHLITEIFVLTEYFVLEYPVWIFVVGHPFTAWIVCTGISVLTESFALDYPQGPIISYWNILTVWIFVVGHPFTAWIVCTGISVLTESFALDYPHWLNILYWNILTVWIFVVGHPFTAWIFRTGISVLTESFALDYPHGLNISLVWQ